MLILDAFTGLKIGALMGLDRYDVDLENGTVNVSKVSQYLSDRVFPVQ
jgi:integrase